MSEREQQQQMFPIEWQVASIRGVAFPASPIEDINIGIWEQLVGELPDTQTYNPKVLLVQEVGVVQERKFALIANPVSIEWRLLPNDAEGLSAEGISTLGTITESTEIFRPLMRRWLEEHAPSLQRLAFIVELLSPAEDRAHAYKQLQTLLPFEINLEGAEDFFYQINRPRLSRTQPQSVRINRLSKWGAVKHGLGMQAGTQSFELPGLDRTYSRLEVDINTDGNFQGELVHNRLGQLLHELTDLSEEVSIKGDVV